MSNIFKKNVLIVDDSVSIRREVRLILEKEGYTVREAGSGFGMLNCIDEYGILVDIILMDLTLNDEYGFDLITKIRNVNRFKDIPVVIITQHSDRENVELARMIGVNGYIVKPINPHMLLERVRNVLKEQE